MKEELEQNIINSPYYFTIIRPVAVLMAVLTAFVFGFVSYRMLPINMMPDISYPSLTVRTEYPGAAPEEVETAVTRPLEQALGVVRDLIEISSSSRAEVSDILLEYNWNTDMNRAVQDVREKLDVVFLQDEVKSPIVLRYDPSLDPLMRLGLTSDSLDLIQLRQVADELIKRELDKVPGVAAVKIKGGEEAEIKILIDPVKLDLLNISIESVLQRLAAENINIAGGHLEDGKSEYILRTLNEFKSLADINNIVITTFNTDYIRLRDVALVDYVSKERSIITRVNGTESVELEIFKESDANPINVSDNVKTSIHGRYYKDRDGTKKSGKDFGKKELKTTKLSISEQLTDRIQIAVLSDQSVFIDQSIADLSTSAIFGGILASIVLLFFLRKIKDTLAITIVIPISLISTFAAMHIFGVTLNIMSLGGLALGVGMLVDNAIVVIESIHRRREEGDGLITAAVNGTRIVGGAVIASTLTTIVVFFPIVFVTGVAGQVFGDMALTVIVSILISLFTALFVIPVIMARGVVKNDTDSIIKINTEEPLTFKSISRDNLALFKSWKSRNILIKSISLPIILIYAILKALFTVLLLLCRIVVNMLVTTILKIIKRIKNLNRTTPEASKVRVNRRIAVNLATMVYVSILKLCMRIPKVILSVTLLICTLSIVFILPELGGELIPQTSQGTFDIIVSLPIGTPLNKTAAITGTLENKLLKMPDIKNVSSRIGGELISSDIDNLGPHGARITVQLNDLKQSQVTEERVISELRDIVNQIPSLEISVDHPNLFTFKKPIEIVIVESDLDKIREKSKAAEQLLAQIPGLVDIESSVRPGYPEISIQFDRDKLANLGISAKACADRINTFVQGQVPTKYREDIRRVDIRVQLEESKRESLDDLRNIVINPDQRIPVRLKDIAQLEIMEGPSEIKRVGGTRCAVLTADMTGANLRQSDDEIISKFAAIGMQHGFDYKVSGQRQEMDESLNSLKYAIFLAIFLVYVVMASQFESFLHPFLILLTVPIALAGTLPFLWLFDFSISIMVALGLIVLVGIVVNNSIVLIDYTNQLINSGMEVTSAIIAAGQHRFRPVMMTSLTTVLGLLPLALGYGQGAEIRQPMAFTVIVGLSLSTMISLVIIPLLYRTVSNAQKINKPVTD